MAEDKVFDLVVVGAGLTGIKAADACQASGMSVLVLEGRDRLGGRTLTKQEMWQGQPTYVDFGAHFIGHDKAQENITKLVTELELKTFPQYEGPDDPSLLWDGQGANLLVNWNSDGNGQILKQAYIGQIYPDNWSGKGRMLELEALLEEMKLWGIDGFVEKAMFDSYSVAGWVESLSSPRDENLYNLLNLICRVGFSADAEEISMLWFMFYICTSGGLDAFSNVRYSSQGAQGYRLVKGTMAISDALARRFTAHGGVILKEKMVIGIDLGQPIGVVKCDDGSVYWATKVLVATSPRLASPISISPALPDARRQAARAMRNGQTVMTVMHFKEPFWRKDTTTYRKGTYGLRTVDDISANGLSGNGLMMNGPIVWTMDNTSYEGAPAMFAFVVGKTAKEWAEKSKPTRRKIIANALGTLYGHENVQSQFTEYEEYLWTNDPFAQGCPTGHFGPGDYDLWQHILLKDGVSGAYFDERLFFASTESAMVSNGYMSGAIWSGDKIANRILQSASG